MPDDIERTIYKLEIDDSGYIRGIDSLAASTKKFTDEQNRANERLKINEQALKDNADLVEKTRKALEAYTGTNERYRKQLEKSYGDAQKDQIKLNDLVIESRKSYEQANKAAQDFADTSARATQLQQQTTGGKIPTAVPLGIQSNVVTELQNIVNTGDLSGLPQILNDSSAEFEKLRAAIATAEQAMAGLNTEDAEFVAIQEFVAKGKDAIAAYDAAVKLATVSTAELGDKVTAAQAQIAKISATEISELPATVEQSKTEFDELRVSIEAAETRLQGLDNASDEFKKLAPVVNAGKIALQQYDAVAIKAGSSTLSLRSQIRIGREELVRMEQAGKSATKEFFELEKRVASLTDAYGDQQERIKVLASDTRVLDFGKASIQTATAAFQAYTSVSILAGGASEELQRKTLQLFAAMQILTALEQLSNSVKRGSVIATNLQSVAQATYTAVVGASTGALRAFRIALLSTGIGAVVVGIGILVNRLSQIASESSKAAEAQKRLNDVMKEAKGAYVQAVTEVENLKTAFAEAREGIRTKESAVKLYNETIGKTTGAVKTLDEAEQQLTKNADAYIQFTLLKAAAQIALGKAAEAAFEIQQTVDTTTRGNIGRELQIRAGVAAATAQKLAQDAGKSEGEIKAAYNEAFEKAIAGGRAGKQVEAEKQLKDIAVNLQNQANALALQFKFKTGEVDVDTKTLEDSFAVKLADLKAKLKEVTAKSFESDTTIRDQFAASLEKEIESIKEKFGKDLRASGVPGKTRFEVLVELAARINDIQLQESLNQFNKKVRDARQKIEDDLNALQSKVALDTINLIQDEFQRRAALIDANEQKELQDAKDANAKRLESLDLNKLLIGEQAYQDARAEIISTGEQTVLNIIARGAQARQELSQDVFDKLLSDLGSSLDERDVEAAEQLATQIQNEREKLNAGAISQKQFEDNVTEITKAAIDFRTELRRKELELQLQAVNVALEASDDPKFIDDLKKKQLELRAAIATIDTDTAKTTGDSTKKIDTVQDYVTAIAGLTDSIVSFWQAANAAEAAALDRSIALQERRVDAAQRIAERGNAQYLKAETDRLKELQVARENAARRELAINAALQASQLLVGITGAITKIATPGIGTAEVIAAIAVIFGALATGYGLVKSLQGNQPRLKKGTTYVSRETHPAGTDTIPAWLTEGEAVIPAARNKSYKRAVEAIYHEKIPAKVLNEFVENYVKNRKETKDYREIRVDTSDSFASAVHRVVNEVSDKKLTINEIKDFISRDAKVFSIVESVYNLVNNRLNKTTDSTISVADVKKYSEIIDKTFTENKSLVENKNIVGLVRRIVNEVSDKQISVKQVASFIDNKTSAIIQTVVKLINERVDISELVNKNVSIDDVRKYSEIITKNENLSTYRRFVHSVSKVPPSVLNHFITNYQERKYFRGTPDLKGAAGIDKIPVLATAGEAIIPGAVNNLYKPTVKAIFEGIIPPEQLNNFVKNFHTTNIIPQVNYQRIKEAAETHISSDGKLAGLLVEQNRLLVENTDVQRATMRALQKMGVSVNMDKNGIAVSVMEVIEQVGKDKRV